MSQVIANAFDTRLSAINLKIDIQYEGVVYEPKAGRPYLSARLASYSRTNTGPGGDCVMQETGTYQISVNWPAGEGRQPAGEIADVLVAFFPRSLLLTLPTNQTVSVLYASAAPAMLSGDWLTVPVVVTWFATNP